MVVTHKSDISVGPEGRILANVAQNSIISQTWLNECVYQFWSEIKY